MPNLLLAGYFGEGNLGDDAIMLGFVEGMAGSGCDFMAMSGAPEETFRLHGINAIPRKDMKQYENAVKSCDAVVFPGGSIFQDVTSVKSVAYYQALVKKAKSAGKKVIMLGQGVGPLTSFLGKRMAAAAFNAADVLAVRDPQSATLIKELGVRHTPRITGDMAFLLPQPQSSDENGAFNVGGMKTIGVSARPLPGKINVPELIGGFCQLVFKGGMMPVLIEMDRNADQEIINAIGKLGGKTPDLKKLGSPGVVQQRLARMDAVVAMRLHAGILATSVGVPAMMLNYDPKVAAFARSLDIGSALPLDGLTPERMYETFQKFMKDRERHLKVVERKRIEFSEGAKLNIEICRQMIR